jgi:hypothetical protein
LATISKSYNRTDDTTKLGARHSITLNGTIVAWKGSPNSSGVFWELSNYPPDQDISQNSRQKAIISKQEALKQLFSLDYKLLEIVPWDGTAPIKMTPRINSINFPEGIWVELCPYSIDMEADIIYGAIIPSGEDAKPTYITSANENWSVESLEKGENAQQYQMYKLTHSIEAKGSPQYDINGDLLMEGWKRARSYVTPLLGLDYERIGSGIINLPSYFSGLNHVRGQTIDELGGGYSVTESWILASGKAIEDFTVEVTIEGLDDGLNYRKVSIQGNIEGLEVRDSNYNIPEGSFVASTKFTNALDKFNTVTNIDLLARAQAYSNTQLNPLPINKTVGKNPVTGTISYNAEFDNRPGNIIEDSFGRKSTSESISILDQNQADIIASIFVLGRGAGPVLQNLNTKTAKERELSIEVQMATSGYNEIITNRKPIYDNVITIAEPVASQVYRVADTETWDMKKGRGTRTIRWTYE